MKYQDFLESRRHLKMNKGFKPIFMPDFLFDFQAHLTDWAITTGRGALFEDCGLGKTPQFLVWAENVARYTNKRILILTPLAVSYQIVPEGDKFGIECKQSRDGELPSKIIVTNYEKLHLFNPDDFVGMVCDESSILKNFDGKIKDQIIGFIRKMPYRLLTTATAAPNDYPELGNSSEALGVMGFMDMLNHYFKNDQNSSKVGRHYGKKLQWVFKKHAEPHFWRFVSSWARALRKPSDMGFDDGPFLLPNLIENQHMVDATKPREGEMFPSPAIGLKEQRYELKQTTAERCEKVASLVDHKEPFVCWCNTNPEGDLLEQIIPNAVQVAGKHSPEEKEERFKAFQAGEIQGIITKAKIGGFGLNWQHCAHTTMFPSHSFEQYYQCVRRFLRFGQTKDVVVDVITTPGMDSVLQNLQQKSKAAGKMFDELVAVMNDPERFNSEFKFNKKEVLPAWL